MLYSVYRGDIFVVSSSEGRPETGITKYKIGEAKTSEDLWFYRYNPPTFPGFVQAVDKETEQYILSHQELLPNCPYVWAPLDEEPFFYWAGEKNTRLYVAAPDKKEDDLISLGAVKISGTEKNDSGYSLWYYSSDDPVVPEFFATCQYVWQDRLTDYDFYDPDDDPDAEYPDFDESDDYVEDHEWSEEDSRLYEEYPSFDESKEYDVSDDDEPFI